MTSCFSIGVMFYYLAVQAFLLMIDPSPSNSEIGMPQGMRLGSDALACATGLFIAFCFSSSEIGWPAVKDREQSL